MLCGRVESMPRLTTVLTAIEVIQGLARPADGHGSSLETGTGKGIEQEQRLAWCRVRSRQLLNSMLVRTNARMSNEEQAVAAPPLLLLVIEEEETVPHRFVLRQDNNGLPEGRKEAQRRMEHLVGAVGVCFVLKPLHGAVVDLNLPPQTVQVGLGGAVTGNEWRVRHIQSL
jgi:hypothetical protein